jgi:hypothetical protein
MEIVKTKMVNQLKIARYFFISQNRIGKVRKYELLIRERYELLYRIYTVSNANNLFPNWIN